MPDQPAEWHTAQVRGWLLKHPEVQRWVLEHRDRAHSPSALRLAARAAIEQLPGVDFGLVDWDDALVLRDVR